MTTFNARPSLAGEAKTPAQLTQAEALGLLRKARGADTEFRTGQWDAIAASTDSAKPRTTVVIQATGWGKSDVYFTAAAWFKQCELFTVVISPLRSLIRDQSGKVAQFDLTAKKLYEDSDNTNDEVAAGLANGECPIVFTTPETFNSTSFLKKVLLPHAARLGLIAIDEVHCMSVWGHGFRPQYGRLGNLIADLNPATKILGMTATADERIVSDIRRMLGPCTVQRGSLNRNNLALQVVHQPSDADQMAWLAAKLQSIEGTGIIYVRSKKKADKISESLKLLGVNAPAYYARSSENNSNIKRKYNANQDKTNKQEIAPALDLDAAKDKSDPNPGLETDLMQDKVKALVATTALGMGFDKKDIRFVIHYGKPYSLVDYYQQVGRAGRDGQDCVGILLTGPDDELPEYNRHKAYCYAPLLTDIFNKDRNKKNGRGLYVGEIKSALGMENNKNNDRTVRNILHTLESIVGGSLFETQGRWWMIGKEINTDKNMSDYLKSETRNNIDYVEKYVLHGGCRQVHLVQFLGGDRTPCRICDNCNPQV